MYCLLISLLLGMYAAEKMFMWEDVYSCVHSNFICNSPKMETTLMYISSKLGYKIKYVKSVKHCPAVQTRNY